MKLITKSSPVISSALIGAILGYIGGPALILALWGAVGLLIGLFSNGHKAALINGIAFGFLVSYVFMVAGYNGDASVTTKLLPFVVFGIFGALCGMILAATGYVLKNLRRAPAIP
jgi:uncharacterized membrane protein (UPF0136 family)